MGCGSSFAKILLIIFNIIFWLSGVGLLGIGIWLLVDKNILTNFEFLSFAISSGNLLQYAAYLFIGVGAFVLIVGFFGCCGAIKENRCMLGVYIFLLVLVMGLEIAGGVLAIIYRGKINDEITEQLTNSFKKYYNETGEKAVTFTETMNIVQVKLECCGIQSPADFVDKSLSFPIQCCKLQPSAKEKEPTDVVERDVADLKGCRNDVPGTRHTDPVQCCVLKADKKDAATKNLVEDDAVDYATCTTDLVAENADSLTAYVKGCEPKFKEWVEVHAIILIGVGIGIACLELFGFIFAVCLCRSIQDDE